MASGLILTKRSLILSSLVKSVSGEKKTAFNLSVTKLIFPAWKYSPVKPKQLCQSAMFFVSNSSSFSSFFCFIFCCVVVLVYPRYQGSSTFSLYLVIENGRCMLFIVLMLLCGLVLMLFLYFIFHWILLFYYGFGFSCLVDPLVFPCVPLTQFLDPGQLSWCITRNNI